VLKNRILNRIYIEKSGIENQTDRQAVTNIGLTA